MNDVNHLDHIYRTLKQDAITARLTRDAAIQALKTAEMQAIIGHLEDHEKNYEELGKNEGARDLAVREILHENLDYQRVRRELRVAEQALLERDADLDAYLEGRRREREDLQRAANELAREGRLVP